MPNSSFSYLTNYDVDSETGQVQDVLIIGDKCKIKESRTNY